MEIWRPGALVQIDAAGWAELLVLEGSFEESGDRLHRRYWLRAPMGSQIKVNSGPNGARVWIKTGTCGLLARPRY